jgi:hypothetical protein
MKKLLLLLTLSFVLFAACSESDDPIIISDLDERTQALYDRLPDPDNCNGGMINAAQKNEALARINFIRTTIGLPEVVYDGSQDESLQAAALLMAVNNKLDHNPTASDKCYSEDAAKGASANLWMGTASGYYPWSPSQMVDDLFNDENIQTLGHRLWMLSPFMIETAFGRVDYVNNSKIYTASCVFVDNHDVESTKSNASVQFVAYPRNEIPSSAFSLDWYLHFSIFIDKDDIWKNTADYRNAEIIVEDGSGNKMSVTSIDFIDPNPSTMFGYTNMIKWKVPGLKKDEQYKVTINNVKSAAGNNNYTYTFTISDEA